MYSKLFLQIILLILEQFILCELQQMLKNVEIVIISITDGNYALI